MSRGWTYHGPELGYERVPESDVPGLIRWDAPPNAGRPPEPPEAGRPPGCGPPPWQTPALRQAHERLEQLREHWPEQAAELQRQLPRVETLYAEPGGPLVAYRLRYPQEPAQRRPGLLRRLFAPRLAEPAVGVW